MHYILNVIISKYSICNFLFINIFSLSFTAIFALLFIFIHLIPYLSVDTP